MVFTNEEVAMIEGIIGSFFSGGHVSEDVRHAYSRVWQHLAADTLDTADYHHITNASDYAMKNHCCESCNRESQRILTAILIKATAAF